MLLAGFQSLVEDLVRDRDQVLSTEERDTAIAAAVSRYSVDAPRVRVEDVTSDDGGQRLPVPSGWVDGLSDLRALEYPIGHIPTSTIGLDAVSLYQGPSGVEIVLLISLLPGDQVRVSYTGEHTLTEMISTIPTAHERAVACLAAADLCGQLSAHYATEGAPTLAADTVDHQGKTERYRARARDLAAEYSRMVGQAPNPRTRPAMAETAFDSRDSLGRRTLFHPPRSWPR